MKIKRFNPPVKAGAVAAVALAVMLLGCGAQSSAESSQNACDNPQTAEQNTFVMQKVDSYEDFTLYVDRETGVEYIVYDDWIVLGDRHVFGIVPRYNSDGTLHTGG